MKVDFARINHILIPKTKEERDRFRAGWAGKVFGPVASSWGALTDEGRTLLVVTPLAGAVAVDVLRTNAHIVFVVLTGLLVGSLLVARTLVLSRSVLEVRAPRRVTLGDEVVFRVCCQREPAIDPDPVALRIRGPFLPWDGTWTGKHPEELVVTTGASAETTMTARFVARGMHHLDPFTVAIIAPLGLACGPRRESDGVKVWVVPRIANVLRLPVVVASKHQPGGVALASKAGESMDLVGVRPYRPGDPVRDLHARTWARTGEPAVREYQQEYFTRVGVIIDTSLRDHLEEALELAAGVVANLSRGEALIDMLVVGDAVHQLTLGRSLGRLDQALELLATVVGGPAIDAGKLVRRMDPHLAQLSSVTIVRGPTENGLEAHLKNRGLAVSTLVVDAKLAKRIQDKEALAW